MPNFGPVTLSAMAALTVALNAVPAMAAPRNVVSMNVCTDQMAMLLADDGQLRSISFLASDPQSSALAKQAGRYAMNHGQAEEIFLMKPDLVLAGTYTTRATVDLLRRLDIRVEEFAPAESFDDVRRDFRRMGILLGKSDKAQAMVRDMDSALASMAAAAAVEPGERKKAVGLYFANSYTSASGTLVDAVVGAAGLDNLATRLGLAGTVQLPLEQLVMSAPELLASDDQDFNKPALAQQTFAHPAFLAVAREKTSVALPSVLTVCGGPFTLDAVRILIDAAYRGHKS
jgi:iron complex transport system substrate-binding protein